MVVSFLLNSSHWGDTVCWLGQGWSWGPENCCWHFAADVHCGFGRTAAFLNHHRRQHASTGDGDAKSVFYIRNQLRIPKHRWTLNVDIFYFGCTFQSMCYIPICITNRTGLLVCLISIQQVTKKKDVDSTVFGFLWQWVFSLWYHQSWYLAVFQDVCTWSRPNWKLVNSHP